MIILTRKVSIYHIVKRIIGILCVQWFEVRGEHPKNRSKYIYHIVKRIIGLLCVQWFEVRGEHPKNRSKYISYCKTYYWSFMYSVIWGER
jgi:poly-D-alanine transfer protein DltD